MRLALAMLLAGSVGAALPAQDAFFGKHCVECHGVDDPEGDVRIAELSTNADGQLDLDLAELVLEVLQTEEMPPEDADQPSEAARRRAIETLQQRIERAGGGAEWQAKLLRPEYANAIPHERLFDRTNTTAPWSPSRLWKRSPYIFESLMSRGVGIGRGRYGRRHHDLQKIKQPFGLEDRAGIRDYAALTFADSATLGTLMRNAGVLVDKYLGKALHERHERDHGKVPDDQLPKDKRGRPIRPRFPKTPEAFARIVMAGEPIRDSQIDDAVDAMCTLVVERSATDAQRTKYRTLFRDCMASATESIDPAEALRTMLIAIAISPEAIYRAELGRGPADEHGRRRLGNVDLAYAIAYALTDDPPDELLMQAASDDSLSSRGEVERHVARLWDDDGVPKPRILRFFHEFFGYHNAPNVFKDQARFGKDYRRVAERLVQDCDTLVRYHVDRDENVLEELLTTPRYFVAHSGNNAKEREVNDALQQFFDHFHPLPWREFPYQTPKDDAQKARSIHRMFAHPNGNVVKGWMRYLTACHEAGIEPVPMQNGRQYLIAYNLDEKSFDFPVEQPFVLAKGQRVGILMHPAWLIAHSLNLDNDPVRRGKWIRERLLADVVPDLPITVDARIPDEPEWSLRERFEVTRQKECWRCHVKMNPLGMPFELFDDFGRHRLVEKLHANRKTKPVDSSGELRGTRVAELDGAVEHPIDMMQRLARSPRVRQSFVRHAFRYWMGRNEMESDARTLLAADRAYVENGGSFRALVLSLLTSDSFLYRKETPR